jgi:SAM-dependent methyltransferase
MWGLEVLMLRPPAGTDALVSFDRGWLAEGGAREPFLSYVEDEPSVNWSEELEELHEESTRSHFIDVWTRRAMLSRLAELPPASVVVDVGCSTGHLLSDLRSCLPEATLIGVDLVAGGLRKAHRQVPDARLLQADVCALPLHDASVDAVLSANLLEHVPDDVAALREIHRILQPAGRAVLVVPADPGSYDSYDRFLGHERRYARGELARKARQAGLTMLEDLHLGAPLYPAFWAVKRFNRRRRDHLQGEALERMVKAEIDRTGDSRLGRMACRFEEVLLACGVRLPFGIRCMSVLERPGAGA